MADLNELNEKVEQIKADIREQLEKIENTKGVYEYKKTILDKNGIIQLADGGDYAPVKRKRDGAALRE